MNGVRRPREPPPGMRVLFELNHPAQVHFYRHVIGRVRERGGQVAVASREKGITIPLLDALGIAHDRLSRAGRGIAGKALETALRCARMARLVRRFRPDVITAKPGIAAGPIGGLLRVPAVICDEAEHATLQRRLALPFAATIPTGFGYLEDLGPRQRPYKGVWMQAYLDPRYFRPDPDVPRRAGVNPDEPYIVLRLIAWSAAHDRGMKDIGEEEILRLVRRLEGSCRVIISSEKPLSPELRPRGNPLAPEDMHHLLAFARMCVSEGGSTAAEAAVLGTPTIFCNPLRVGYLLALEDRYRLARNVNTLAEGVDAAADLLARPDLREEWRERRGRLLAESEDVVEFIYDALAEAARGRRGGEGP